MLTVDLEHRRAYREAAEYPRDTYVEGRQPVFIDADERLYAVGYLMVQSGWEDEVRQISERENLEYRMEMPGLPVGPAALTYYGGELRGSGVS